MSFGVHGPENSRVDAIEDIAGNRRRIFLEALDVQKSLLGEPDAARYAFWIWGI
ncbi:MAG TPA: hypothetical protein VJ738_01665 [Steroidobacteraceae bacterium]|nr:hypothetical protein [Steroidobacteraceae bacterium]